MAIGAVAIGAEAQKHQGPVHSSWWFSGFVGGHGSKIGAQNGTLVNLGLPWALFSGFSRFEQK